MLIFRQQTLFFRFKDLSISILLIDFFITQRVFRACRGATRLHWVPFAQAICRCLYIKTHQVTLTRWSPWHDKPRLKRFKALILNCTAITLKTRKSFKPQALYLRVDINTSNTSRHIRQLTPWHVDLLTRRLVLSRFKTLIRIILYKRALNVKHYTLELI